MIKVENLVKKYGSLTAVNNISFSVKKGEVVGLLGPNGAGKSTTMKILTCFMPANAGNVEIAGFNVFSQSLDVRKQIGYMPENVPLYPEMRVNEYLHYRGKLKGLRGNKLKERMKIVIDSCQLSHQDTRIIEQLSKGNRQRVGLADSLISDPALLVLDEPTIGLDPNQVLKVRDLIFQIGQERTVILSSHILSEVETVCQRAIIMSEGKIVFDDTMDSFVNSDEKRYICEINISAKELDKALQQLPELINVEINESDGWSKAKFQSTNKTIDFRELIYNMSRENNWSLRTLDVKSPSLEEIFVSKTAR